MAGLSIIMLFALIVAAVLGAALLKLYKKSRNFSTRTIKTVFFQIPLFRFRVLIPTLLFMGAFMYLYQGALDSTASILISLNYDSASRGQNANGTRYNMSEIICDEVVDRAIEKGALKNVSVKDLASCLSVMPAVSGDATDESHYHVSTEFVLTYTSDKRTSHLDAENVVQLVADSYKEFYIDHYADNFDVLKIQINPENDFQDVDYLDVVDWLKVQARTVSNYMTELAYKNGSFISKDGETFNSIREKVANISDVQLEDNLRAYLLQNGMSKDREGYIGRLLYNNSLNDFEEQKARASFQIRNDAISMYSEEMTRVVLVPTWDESGEYYMGRTKVGIDTLSMEAENYSKTASDYSKGIETNRSVISALQNAGGSGNVSLVEGMIKEISEEIMDLAQKGRKAGLEYSETRMNGIISSSPIYHSLPKRLLLTGGLSLLFFLSLNMYLSAVELSKDKRMKL